MSRAGRAVTLVIEAPADEDWAVLGRLHAHALPHGFFPLLGPGFLAAYLRTYDEGPLGVARVARVDGEPVGFVVGSTLARAHSRWVVRHRGLRLTARAAVAMLARPRALRTFLGSRIRRYLRGLWARLTPSRAGGRAVADGGQGSGRTRDAAVLRHVVVAPRAQGHGVGGALVEAFTDELRRRGTTRARLITRADEGAAGLYERHGWECARRRADAEGDPVLEYIIDLR